MKTNEDIKSEVASLHITGNYTNRELAKKYRVSEQSICYWLKKSQKIKYHKIKLSLEKELNELVLNGDYLNNSQKITDLISDIERIDNLIVKTKY